MKKTKQIFAIIGILLLVALYGSTLLFAFLDQSKSQFLLKSSIAGTIVIPVLLYAYSLIYKLSKKNQEESDDMQE